jgi:NAD(P) transhydrogenase subunit alpha
VSPAEILTVLTIFVLAVFTGFEVISKVPVVLHTPLMSGTNAIHGIVVVGGIVVLAHADAPWLVGLGFVGVVFGAIVVLAEAQSPLMLGLGFVGVVFGAANLVGGLVVTDRMLGMFKKKKDAPK